MSRRSFHFVSEKVSSVLRLLVVKERFLVPPWTKARRGTYHSSITRGALGFSVLRFRSVKRVAGQRKITNWMVVNESRNAITCKQ